MDNKILSSSQLKIEYNNPLGALRVNKYKNIHELFNTVKSLFFKKEIMDILNVFYKKNPEEYSKQTKNIKIKEIFTQLYPSFKRWDSNYVSKDKLKIFQFIEQLILWKMNYSSNYNESAFSYFRYSKIQEYYKKCIYLIEREKKDLPLIVSPEEKELVQKIFNQNEDEKTFNQLTNTDHVLSTKIFQEIIFAFFLDTNHFSLNVAWSYDYINTLKTTINQCWNLCLLPAEINQKKGNLEAKICTLLRELNDQRRSILDYDFKPNIEIFDYFKVVADRMYKYCSQGKDFFGAVKSFRDYFYTFLKKFDRDLYDHYDLPEKTHKRRKSCQCPVCEYCRQNSSRWRFKYFLIFVHSEDPKLPFEKIKEFFDKVKEAYNQNKIGFE